MAKIRRSQVFLKDKNILRKIVDFAEVKEGDWILEIGAGKGYLTEYLLKSGAKVIAIEVDSQLVEYLKKEYALLLNHRLFLYKDDFLKIDLKNILDNHKLKEIKVVSNIPYHITSLILKKLIRNKDLFPEIYLTIQKEVADRITAGPGNKKYGALTLFVNLHFDPEILFVIKKGSFSPVPEVDSAFIKLVRKKQEILEKPESFERFVKKLFSRRRKKLKTILKEMVNDRTILEQIPEEDLSKRPEHFTLEELIKIYRVIKE